LWWPRNPIPHELAEGEYTAWQSDSILLMMKLTVQPPPGGELIPDIHEGDNIKKGPDSEWTRRQPLVDVSKVKPEAGTEIVVRVSYGFW